MSSRSWKRRVAPSSASVAQAARDLEPVEVGEHDVEDDEIGLALLSHGEGGRAVTSGLDVETGVAPRHVVRHDEVDAGVVDELEGAVEDRRVVAVEAEDERSHDSDAGVVHAGHRVAQLLRVVRPLVEAVDGRLADRLDGARDAAVAILEGVDGHEPEMRQRRLQHQVLLGRCVEPCEKGLHFGLNPVRGRSLVVHALAADRPRDNTHGATRIVAPGARPDPRHPAMAGREQGRLPCEQPPCSQGTIEVLGGIEHHFDDALHVAIRRLEATLFHPQTTRDRRADFVGVELFSLDLAAFDHFVC